MKRYKYRPILLIANSSWYINHYRQELINALQAHGEKIMVIAPIDKSSKSLSKKLIYIPWSINRKKNYNPISLFISFFKLLLIIRALKPKLIHSHTMGPNFLSSIISFLYGTPILISFAGGKLFKSKGLKKFLHDLIFTIIAYTSNITRKTKISWIFTPERSKFIFQNHQDLEDFKLKFNFLNNYKLNLIAGSGVPKNYLDSDKIKHKWISRKENQEFNSFTLIYNARLLRSKGIIKFYEISCKLKDHEFKVFGEKDLACHDSLNNYDLEKIKKSSKNIQFMGHIKDPLLNITYNFPILIVPSSYKEGMPRGLLEAMALCIPVISSPIAPRGMIGDEYIYIAEEDSPNHYLKCLNKIIKDHQNNVLIDKLLKAKSFIDEKYSEEFIVKETMYLYEEMLKMDYNKNYLLNKDNRNSFEWISQ